MLKSGAVYKLPVSCMAAALYSAWAKRFSISVCVEPGEMYITLKFCDNGFSAQGKRCQRRGEDVEGFPFGNAVSYFLRFHTKKILKLAKVIQPYGQNMPEGVFCQP